MKILRIGIASIDAFKARTIAIAKGRAKPAPGEPKIWFNSAQSVGKLIDDNCRCCRRSGGARRGA
jgi:predicted transcriptional regulator